MMQWKNRTRNIRDAIRVRGGLIPVLRLVFSVVQRERLGGLKRLLARSTTANNYDEWVQRYDTIDAGKRADLRQRVGLLPLRPLISIVVPVYNPAPDQLAEMIDSVRRQIYPDWELCLCDDASTAPGVLDVLTRNAREDARIKFIRRQSNGHICVATNDAISIATGTWIALLDHDDLLSEHALYMVASYINRHPQVKMWYSDEDKLAADGGRVEPYFKTDWNAVLMLGQNAFSHLGVFDSTLLQKVGGFRPGLEGSQDHDLVLRCAEVLSPAEIGHIPHILYHWRLGRQSTAQNVAAKPYARKAALRAVTEHLQRTGQQAKVEFVSPYSTMLKVIYEIPDPAPLVSIIIPTKDRPDLLGRCLESLFRLTSYPAFELIIIDNGTTDPKALKLLDHYSERANVQVLRIDAPFNFAALNNAAVQKARGQILCLLNNDIEISTKNWLSIQVGYATQPWAGAIGAALRYPDDRLQHGGVILSEHTIAGHMHHLLPLNAPGYFGRAMLAQGVSAVTAACLVARKDLYDEVGGMAEELAIAYNDIDFCLAVEKAGFQNVYVPYATAFHHESSSRGHDRSSDNADRLVREQACMTRRWHDRLRSDRYHNVNLSTQDGEFFSLASPPRLGQFD